MTIAYKQERIVGREVRHYEGKTLEDLHVETKAAMQEFRAMDFLPQLRTPVLTHVLRNDIFL